MSQHRSPSLELTKAQAQALVVLAQRYGKSVSELNVWKDGQYEGHVFVTIPKVGVLYGITPDGHTHS